MIARRRRIADEDGFTLIEVLVAILLISVGVLATFGTLDSSSHLTASVTRTNNAGLCGQSTASETTAVSFPPITVPTVTDDARICVPTLAPCSGTSNGISWNAAQRNLILQNTGNSFTLTGNTYVFCNLTLNNGTLFVKPANNKPVSIYFQRRARRRDSPSARRT